jgi:hypothetical protein
MGADDLTESSVGGNRGTNKAREDVERGCWLRSLVVSDTTFLQSPHTADGYPSSRAIPPIFSEVIL